MFAWYLAQKLRRTFTDDAYLVFEVSGHAPTHRRKDLDLLHQHSPAPFCPEIRIQRSSWLIQWRHSIPPPEHTASTEGTTQGDPLAMAMYALSILPLIYKLKNISPDVKQVWYADDATEHAKDWDSGGSMLNLVLYQFPAMHTYMGTRN